MPTSLSPSASNPLPDSASLPASASASAAQRVAAHPWETTPLGPTPTWSAELRTTASLVLGSRFPSALVWGPSLTTVHNDAFHVLLGDRPDAMGRSFADVWSDAWPTIGPSVERAFAGEATFDEDVPLRVVRGGAAEQRAFTFSRTPVRDAAGRVLGVVETAIETTAALAASAALEAEVRRFEQAEEHLRQAQKMEAFGQLTGGIAHDFNNLLQAISGSLEMLGRKHVHHDDGQRLLRLAHKAIDRAAHLTRQLLAFARKQPLNVKPIDVNGAVATSVELATRTLPTQVTVVRRFDDGAWPVLSDPNQLDVAILNLIINARDAMPDGGRITVATGNVVAPSPTTPPDLADGHYVCLSIIDTGVGMSADIVKRVFEPFFTTKDVGKGTGLGLSQVYGFARQSGGGTRILSTPGEGTQVDVYLPRSRENEAEAVEEDAVAAWHGRESVLVVDDDDDVRELAVACLVEFGYRVLSAPSGLDALEVLGREASIDLLLIDFAMPGMNGAETVRVARRVRPELEVLFITGYADLRAVSEHVGMHAIVQKPFKIAHLANSVAKALARRTVPHHPA